HGPRNLSRRPGDENRRLRLTPLARHASACRANSPPALAHSASLLPELRATNSLVLPPMLPL
ncbi:hypothetical protein ACV2ZF_27260, partial [Escherichia coli]